MYNIFRNVSRNMILISMIFLHIIKMYNFDPYNILLAIARNIPVKTAFALQGHKYVTFVTMCWLQNTSSSVRSLSGTVVGNNAAWQGLLIIHNNIRGQVVSRNNVLKTRTRSHFNLYVNNINHYRNSNGFRYEYHQYNQLLTIKKRFSVVCFGTYSIRI